MRFFALLFCAFALSVSCASPQAQTPGAGGSGGDQGTPGGQTGGDAGGGKQGDVIDAEVVDEK